MVGLKGNSTDRKNAHCPHTNGPGNEPVGRHALTHQGSSTRASRTSPCTTTVARETARPEQTESKCVRVGVDDQSVSFRVSDMFHKKYDQN